MPLSLLRLHARALVPIHAVRMLTAIRGSTLQEPGDRRGQRRERVFRPLNTGRIGPLGCYLIKANAALPSLRGVHAVLVRLLPVRLRLLP